MALERLQKILARAGVSSRRHAEQLVLAGRVRVNGKVVTELGSRADPFVDKVEVDGHRAIAEAPVYVIMHKPRATVSTASDPEGRPTVTALVSGIRARLYPVGRLDFQTSGALLLTNDGEFAAGMLHPSRKVPKLYLVKVEGEISEADAQRWRDGVVLDDGVRTQRAEVRVIRVEDGKSWLEVELHEGRNQQIRRMGTATGFEVLRLTRLSFAGIGIDGLRPGGWRLLTPDELKKLRDQHGVPRRVKPAVVDENDLPDQHPSRRDTARRGGLAPARPRPAGDRPLRRDDQDSPRDFDRKRPPRDESRKPFQKREQVAPRDFDRIGPPRDEGKKPFQRRDEEAPRKFDRKGPPRDEGKKPFQRRDEEAPRKFDRKGPPRDEGKKPFQRRDEEAPRKFDRKGPPRDDARKPFQRRDEEAPRKFDRKGPPRDEGKKPFQRRDEEAPRKFDRKGPPRDEGKKPFQRRDEEAPRKFDRKGPPRDEGKKPFQRRDEEAPRKFDRKGPPRDEGKKPFQRRDEEAPRKFDRKGPPRDEGKKPFQRRDEEAPRKFDRKGPPRDDSKRPFDRKGPPRDKKPHGKPAKGKARGGKPVAKRRSQNRKKEE